ncbi:proprotein convertase P-domain-containing protein [Terracoccus luteus]|uniref:Proprotein convertase P-domain-containing protein n=1 Tax=Terracoccus luteus TaxID=53356 RepID=A0A495XX39_9MICO|nr:S8 family serine peptidase [Terracoccus luteus]RKT77705.1 proprotein convertase P-domain-containing protein [Terracoccus luteus]
MISNWRRPARSGARTIGFSRGVLTGTLVAALSIPLTAAALTPSAAAAATPPGQIGADTAAQIAALQKVKGSLSGAERKLDSALAVSLKARTDASLRTALPRLDTAKGAPASSVTVDIEVTAVTDGLLARLRATGASVAHASKVVRSIRATVPTSALTTVAGFREVTHVRAAGGAMTSRAGAPATTSKNDQAAPGRIVTSPPSKSERTARVETALKKALNTPGRPSVVQQGELTSEGDAAHAADTARARFKVTGTGVKVCALSDGIDSVSASVASGDLPPIDVLPGQEGSGDEGTAMLEIIHDLAPNAELGFATAFTSAASFADNIRALREQGDCDIIVDDVLYFAETPFQDGPIAQAVNDVTADGALYFSSAGNEGNVIDGTSGNYEGDFNGSGQTIGKFAGSAHDFDPGDGVQLYEPLSDESQGVVVPLFWADPLGQAADDYDLYLLDAAGNVTGFSQDVQDGDDDPFEILQTGAGAGQKLAVVKYAGADRYLQLSALRGRYEDANGLTAYVTPGVTRGHSAAVNAVSTAAAPAAGALPFDLEAGDPPNPTGPFPGVFTRDQLPERFTSDGPRRVFFEADGTPYTPGNTTSTGGVVRQKPDVTAADGVRTTAPGFDPFFGTSAAAPHAAALAALALSGNPGVDPDSIRTAMIDTAIDLAPAGVDNRTGHGIVLATRLLQRTGATPQPLVRAGEPRAEETSGDGDGYLEPGETGSLTVPVTNVGDGRATSVSVRLTTSDAGVSLRPAVRRYGSLAAGATAERSFTVSLADDYPLGKPVTVQASVSFVGVLSPTSTTLTVATGQPAETPTEFAYTGPAVPIPDNDAAGASVTIPVTGSEYASKVTFSVDGETCTTDTASTTVGLDHTYVGDLVGTLTSPSGATATLFSRNGGSGNNLCQVVFDDDAAASFSTVTSADAPFTGTWSPISPLSALTASPVVGDWTFSVVDQAGGDSGSIRAVTLSVTGFVE